MLSVNFSVIIDNNNLPIIHITVIDEQSSSVITDDQNLSVNSSVLIDGQNPPIFFSLLVRTTLYFSLSLSRIKFFIFLSSHPKIISYLLCNHFSLSSSHLPTLPPLYLENATITVGEPRGAVLPTLPSRRWNHHR